MQLCGYEFSEGTINLLIQKQIYENKKGLYRSLEEIMQEMIEGIQNADNKEN